MQFTVHKNHYSENIQKSAVALLGCSSNNFVTKTGKKYLNGYKNNLSEKILLLNWFVEVATNKRTATINK